MEEELAKPGSWKFNETIAKQFYQEASLNIPDYLKIISLITPTVREIFGENNELFILDVGSAIGYTVDKLLGDGFKNVYGVDSSRDMINYSQHAERIYHSDQIPTDKKWDVIIINWTLHFIKDRQEFLCSAYDSLLPGGLLFLTEKTLSPSEIDSINYKDFKIAQGMSLTEIENKTRSLEGILVSKPLEWYIETLEFLGFKDISIINSRFMFKTIIARKF